MCGLVIWGLGAGAGAGLAGSFLVRVRAFFLALFSRRRRALRVFDESRSSAGMFGGS